MAKNKTTLAFSTPISLKEKIKAMAKDEGKSLSLYITMALMKNLNLTQEEMLELLTSSSNQSKGVDNTKKIE